MNIKTAEQYAGKWRADHGPLAHDLTDEGLIRAFTGCIITPTDPADLSLIRTIIIETHGAGPLKLDSDGPTVSIPLDTRHDHDWVVCDYGYDTDYEPETPSGYVEQCVVCAEYRTVEVPEPTVTASPTVCGQCGSPDVTVHDRVVLSYRPVAINGAIIPRGSTESSQVANLPDGSVRTIDDFYDEHLDIDEDETTECLNCGRIGRLYAYDVVPARRARKFHVAYTGTDRDYEAVGRHQPLDPSMLPSHTFEPDGVVVGQYQGDVYLYAVDADEAERLVVEAASYPITIELVEEDGA